MTAEFVMFPTWELKAVKWRLLSICSVATVFKLIPLRVFKKVLLTVTLVADETVEPKLSAERAGREMNSMILTAVNSLN
jgi:hypothetical protein